MLDLTILLIEIEIYLVALHHYLPTLGAKVGPAHPRCNVSLTGRTFDVFQDNLGSDFTTLIVKPGDS